MLPLGVYGESGGAWTRHGGSFRGRYRLGKRRWQPPTKYTKDVARFRVDDPALRRRETLASRGRGEQAKSLYAGTPKLKEGTIGTILRRRVKKRKPMGQSFAKLQTQKGYEKARVLGGSPTGPYGRTFY